MVTEPAYYKSHIYNQNKIRMKKNMGIADRAIRTLLAIVMIALYLTGTVTGVLGIILIVASVIFLLTSLISFCPLYLPFGLSTLRKKLANNK